MPASDAPGPRLQQLMFAALVALDLALRFAGEAEMTRWPVVSAVLLAAVTAAVFVVPLVGLSRPRLLDVLAVLAVLDIAVIGLTRLSSAGSAAAVLVVGPAIWLGLHYARAGVVLATAASVLLVALPGLAYGGLDGTTLSRSVLPTVVAAAAAYVVASTVAHVRAGRDLTERQQQHLAEAAATIESQRRFADAVLDTVDVGLVLLDADGRYQTLNRRQDEFMQIAYPGGHAGMAGQVGFVYGDDALRPLTRDETPTYRASQGEEFEDCRLWIGEDQLTRRAISVSARSVHDASGAFAGAALAYKDVTGFMRALRVKDQFVASVSHELRTPLTSIHGYASILAESDDLPPRVIEQLEVVVRNTERLNRLVDDLLHSAQSVEGPLRVAREPTDVAQVVCQSVQAAGPAASRAGIEVVTAGPETLVALVDPQRLAQVVDNLVSNAIKYTPRGGRVEVRLGVDHDRIDLAVHDTGIGISPADRDRLFTRFFRAQHADELSIPGIGLGLSITKAIVESHGGRIEVESTPGTGSVFRVRIPLDLARGAVG